MVFSHNPAPQNLCSDIFLNLDQLEQVQSFKYIGVMLDCRLTFNKQAETSALKAKRAVGAAMRTFRGSAPHSVLDRVYNSCVIPQISYAWEACYPKNRFSKEKIEKVQKFYLQNYCNRYNMPYEDLRKQYEDRSGKLCPPLWLMATRQSLKLYYKYYHNHRYLPNNKLSVSTCRRSNRTTHNFHVEPANCSAATGFTFYNMSTKVWNALPADVPGKLFSSYVNFLCSDRFTEIVRQFDLHCTIT